MPVFQLRPSGFHIQLLTRNSGSVDSRERDNPVVVSQLHTWVPRIEALFPSFSSDAAHCFEHRGRQSCTLSVPVFKAHAKEHSSFPESSPCCFKPQQCFLIRSASTFVFLSKSQSSSGYTFLNILAKIDCSFVNLSHHSFTCELVCVCREISVHILRLVSYALQQRTCGQLMSIP